MKRNEKTNILEDPRNRLKTALVTWRTSNASDTGERAHKQGQDVRAALH